MMRVVSGMCRGNRSTATKETRGLLSSSSDKASSIMKEKQTKSKDLEFCQPAILSAKEMKELEARRKELEAYNQKILEARKKSLLTADVSLV